MMDFFVARGFDRFSFFEFQAVGRGKGDQEVHGLDQTARQNGFYKHLQTARCPHL